LSEVKLAQEKKYESGRKAYDKSSKTWDEENHIGIEQLILPFDCVLRIQEKDSEANKNYICIHNELELPIIRHLSLKRLIHLFDWFL